MGVLRQAAAADLSEPGFWIEVRLTCGNGVTFGRCARKLPARTRHMQSGPGAAYGSAVWACSYLGWIPALGILKPASEHPPARNVLMISVHFVWDATTAITLRELERIGRRNALEGSS